MANNPQDTRKPSTGTQSSGSSGSSSSGQHGSSGSSGSSSSSHGSSGSGNYSFSCKDAGHSDCNWQTRGNSEDEILRNVEPHAKQHHNIQNFDENTKNKVRGAIKRSAA